MSRKTPSSPSQSAVSETPPDFHELPGHEPPGVPRRSSQSILRAIGDVDATLTEAEEVTRQNLAQSSTAQAVTDKVEPGEKLVVDLFEGKEAARAVSPSSKSSGAAPNYFQAKELDDGQLGAEVSAVRTAVPRSVSPSRVDGALARFEAASDAQQQFAEKIELDPPPSKAVTQEDLEAKAVAEAARKAKLFTRPARGQALQAKEVKEAEQAQKTKEAETQTQPHMVDVSVQTDPEASCHCLIM